MRMVAKAGLSLLALIPLLYFLARIFAVLDRGYSMTEMDWNHDGSTSIQEFLRSSDVEGRAIERGGQRCIVYFSYKDGLPISVRCEGGDR